jgi:hypothetical protein
MSNLINHIQKLLGSRFVGFIVCQFLSYCTFWKPSIIKSLTIKYLLKIYKLLRKVLVFLALLLGLYILFIVGLFL